MPLFLGRHENESREGFRRATYEWDDGAIVIEPAHDGGLRLSVSSGSEQEEHEIHFDPERLRAISNESKLITIEEIGKSGARDTLPAHINKQSKLITIEDTRGRRLAKAVIVVP